MDQEAPMHVMTITDAAAARVRAMIEGRGKPTGGVRVGVRTAGCSGLSYTLEFADEVSEFDAVVRHGPITVFVDPKAQPYLQGTEMDFVEKDMESGFVFNNPNEKSRCGCGESFHV
ncbi:MAG: iron-sulfur cluster assembly accessory protein [Proteobacteria bacterium]|nr:iron-sulfur cluster assembly accessory protein [Pseudomonadota bacterium]